MQDILSQLDRMRRPRLLIRAARIGSEDYRREQALKRVLGFDHPRGNGAALAALMEIEGEMEEMRRCSVAGYSATRHVEVMIAIMGEARLMRASLGL
ncbi:MAG: DUF6477 family protein [Roseovarius sp.]